MPELPDGVITLLMTDIERSTPLWEECPAEMARAVARHDAIAAEMVAARGGTVVKSRGEGDSLFCVFARPSDAIETALALQTAFADEPWPAGCALRVRMALYSGEAELREGDYRGAIVNRCARIRWAGHGGQILLSTSTHDLVRESLAPDVRVIDHGDRSLPGLSHSERIYQIVHPRLPQTFPPLRSEAEYPNNLPRQLTSFVGRERELETAAALMAKGPLLTLTGAGGSGKTRLALELGSAAVGDYCGGVWLVELAPLAAESAVLPTVSVALARLSPGLTTVELLAERLRPDRSLLILDNCEHVLRACRDLTVTLLKACPKLTILATSREPLGVSGETAFPVPTLSRPDPSRSLGPKRLLQYEAIRLFQERAQAALPSFDITAESGPSVAEICQRLDGIPLAIELAAARVRSLSPHQIAERLHNRFQLLKQRDSSAMPRHQTLEAAVAWSYDLISETEQRLLRSLSVFAGGCTLESAESICADDADDDLLDTLARLVDKSLVVAEQRNYGAIRYSLLETIRQFAAARLAERGEAETVRDLHRDHYLSLAEEAEPHLQLADQKIWLERLAAEHDNLRAALAWSTDGDFRLRLAAALWRFWYMRGFAAEGRGWLEGALSRPGGSEPVRARALNGAGVLAIAQGEDARAKEHLTACLDLRTALGDQAGIAGALNNLGLVARNAADYQTARRHYADSIEIARRSDNLAGLAIALVNLGTVCIEDSDLDTAADVLGEALEIHRRLQDDWATAATLHNLGATEHERQNDRKAIRYLREAIAIKHSLGDTAALVLSIDTFASALAALGFHGLTVRLLAASQEVISESKGAHVRAEVMTESKQALAKCRNAIGEEEFAIEWESGLNMSMEAVVELALEAGIDNDPNH